MSRDKGFTLIELMIVVVIIGILAAMAVVRYKEAVDQTKYGEVQLRLKQIRNALEDYYTTNGCYPQDKWPNKPPDGLVSQYLDEWPDPKTDPFNSRYDYDVHVIDGKWYVYVTYLGKNNVWNIGTPSYLTKFTRGYIGQIQNGDDWFIIVEKDAPICIAPPPAGLPAGG